MRSLILNDNFKLLVDSYKLVAVLYVSNKKRFFSQMVLCCTLLYSMCMLERLN